jgi:hypothetical protein
VTDFAEVPTLKPEQAFWQALATVGIPSVLVFGGIFYFFGIGADEWFVYVVFSGVPIVLLLPLVYRRYRKGPPPPLTSKQHKIRAIIFGCVATFYLVALAVRPDSRREISTWVFMGGWSMMATNHFLLARKSEQTPSPQA